ncbi:G-box-binding factor-like [Schistocerca cancellata]|uniref:G-box-binding factor-like n=1 Tax=Schistocerca cancellata TaxID=274614 RepID=UPI0021197FA5|nr:G-box-binding factor-like [Schistocerca cancellata]
MLPSGVVDREAAGEVPPRRGRPCGSQQSRSVAQHVRHTCATAGKGRLYPAYSLSGSEGEPGAASVAAPDYRSLRHPAHHHRERDRDRDLHHHQLYGHSVQPQYQHQLQHLHHQQQQQYAQIQAGGGAAAGGGGGGGGGGLSDTPTSENASDATLTDSELALARDSTLLVHNGESKTRPLSSGPRKNLSGKVQERAPASKPDAACFEPPRRRVYLRICREAERTAAFRWLCVNVASLCVRLYSNVCDCTHTHQ